MKKLIILFILSLTIALNGETYQGYVYDEAHKPLQEVLVIHGENSTFSQENGYFLLNSKSQADSLIIYYAFHEIIKINREDFEGVRNFTLRPLKVQLSTFTFTTKRRNNQLPSSEEKVIISLKDKASENSNLAQVITQENSVKIEGTKLPGEKQTASILGHSSRHTLVMLDGIPLNNNGEDFDLASIPIELVDEVEIYKNNVSSLSGGGGMAGVINIRTKKTSRNNSEFSLNTSYGSYRYKKISSSMSANLGNISFYSVLSTQSSANDFEYKIKKGNKWEKDIRLNNSKKSSNLMLNLSAKLSFIDIYYSSNYSHYDNELPGPTNFLDLYNGAKIEGYDFYNNLKLSKKIADLSNFLELYSIQKESNYTNLKANIPLNKADNDSENNRYALKLRNEYNFANIQFSLVNSALQESYRHKSKFQPNSDISKTTQYSYASNIIGQIKDDYDLFSYNFISSFRYDKHNRFADFTTYRFSGDLTYDYLIKPTFLFSYGTSFTVPSFYSLYWKGDSHAVGNPDLFPEESKGYQVGLNLEYANLQLKLNYSFNEIDNLIQWIEVQLQGGIWKPVNIGSSEISNTELKFVWEILPQLKVSTEGLFTKTKNKTLKEDGNHSSYYGKELVYIPEYIYNIGLEYEVEDYNFQLEYTKTGKQWTTQDNLKDPLVSYALLNANLSKKISLKKFEHNLSIGLNNILNNYYEIIKYNPQAPFNWSISYAIKYIIK